MKGIILAGGLGSRLYPLTKSANKHLLPVYNQPMIFYPIKTLVDAGITDVMVIVSGPHSGDFLSILKNGKELGLDHLEYAYQDKPDGGIADALALAEDFAKGEKIAVILGDNTMDGDMYHHIQDFRHYHDGAMVFLKQVPNPKDFGVPRFDDKHAIVEILEKPETPPSDCAVIGLYLYDSKVFEYIKACTPSSRGQLEISDVNNKYIAEGKLLYRHLFCFWQDAGTFDNLYLANKYWYDKAHGDPKKA